MLVEHTHHIYELSGTMDTDDYSADFVYTRRPFVRRGETILPPQSHRQKYLQQLLKHEGLFLPDFEVIEPSMTNSSHESFNQPRVRISGSLYIKEPSEAMRDIPAGAMRYLGGPVTKELLAKNALQLCTHIIVGEFEQYIMPRESSLR
jgi:hypothetical protein